VGFFRDHLRARLSVVVTTLLAISIAVAPAGAKPRNKVCRGELYSAEGATDPHFKDATWIGSDCFFKKSNLEAARRILEECHIKRPCVVEAAVLNSGEIVEVHFVKLPGREMTCRGKLNRGEEYWWGQCEDRPMQVHHRFIHRCGHH
jgi:hypothetical protein